MNFPELKENQTYFIKLSGGFAKYNKLPVYFEAVSIKQTPKAAYLYGTGTLRTKVIGICMQCGRSLTHPVSKALGIGPICGGHYHNWDVVGGYTKENIERLSKEIENTVMIDGWVPKTTILEAEEIDRKIDVPTDHKMTNRSKKKEDTRKVILNEKGKIIITFPFNYNDLENVKTLTGPRFNKEGGPHWIVPFAKESIELLKEWKFEISNELEEEYQKRFNGTIETIGEIEIPGLIGPGLFPFQKQGVAFLERRNGNAIIGDSMGLGKTCQSLAYLQLHPEKRPVIVVCPASLKLNWAKECRMWMPNPHYQIINGTDFQNTRLDAEIYIINYDIFANKYESYYTCKKCENELQLFFVIIPYKIYAIIYCPKCKKFFTEYKENIKKRTRELKRTGWVDYLMELNPQILITDECFPAGTKISTPKGETSIEKLKKGDLVYNAMGTGVVQHTNKKHSINIISLHLENGQTINCTANHPFFTQNGWSPAKECCGEYLLTSKEIFNMRQRTSFTKSARVERVEVQKPRSDRITDACIVYNLQVSGHPSYYAEGYLVHNCQYYVNPQAARTKSIKKLAKKCPHVIPLSGTPIKNRPKEFFNALSIVEPGLFPSFWKFAHRYCNPKHNGFGWDFNGASNIEELHNHLQSVMIRRKKEDVLKDLPAKIRSVVPLELTATAKKEYALAAKDTINWIRENEGAEKAEKAKKAKELATINKLKQLVVKGKLDACIEWIKDFLNINNKLVIFADNHWVIDKIMSQFPKIAVKLDGRDSQQARDKAVEQFQNDENTRLFVASEAAKEGLTLIAASSTCFIQLWWVPADHEQAEDRVHRIGQEADSVNAYYLIADGTIENTIAALIDKKMKVLDAILDGKETDQDSLLTELLKELRKQ